MATGSFPFSRHRGLPSGLALMAFAGLYPLRPTAGAELAGTVTCKGIPVREAHVTVPSLRLHALTDSLGRYRFDIATGISPLRAAGRSRPLVSGNRTADGKWVGLTMRPARFSPGLALFPVYASPSDSRMGSDPGEPGSGSLGKEGASAAISISVSARGYLDGSATAAAGQSKADIALARDYRKHLWVWQTEVFTVAAERKALLDFGDTKGIGTYYVNAGDIGTQAGPLATFIDSAHGRGCAVELLFGAPEWALAANHPKVEELAAKARALAESQIMAGRTAPTAMQLDVEPYGLDEYAADSNGVGIQWIEMFEKTMAKLRGSAVGVDACVPRWLEGRPVTRGNRTRPLNEWIADASDRLTLMDYVDKPKPVIDGAAQEIAYAHSTGKEVVVGVETIAGLDPPSVTFAEEGEAAMEATLADVMTAYKADPAFFGTAVHHYLSYRALKP
ncbi:MAG: hypothetical protein JWP91_962 [Fibrobacteres bacterium]|nr:hypothetical protein [Fibrobacterota bacterium]